MRDLELEAIMHGEKPTFTKSSKKQQTKKDESEDENDLIIDKLLDEYIDDNSLLENASNSLIPVHLQRAKLREELKAATKMPELDAHLKTAFNVLLNESVCRCVDSNKYREMKQQLLEASNYLAEIDFSEPLDQNFAELLHLDTSTLETIFTIAQEKYNDNELEECLSIFALLTTLNPEDFDYWYRLGIVAYQFELYPLALRAFINATYFNSDFLGSRIFATDSCIKLNKYDQAKAEFIEVKSLMEREFLDPAWIDLVSQIKKN